jgi:excisionase family DNA binding protein
MTDLPELLKPQQVAELFQVSYHTALDIIKYSNIGYVKIGKQYRVPKDALIAYMQRKGNKQLL